MVVGVCRVSLMLEGSQSLKEKRSVLRKIKDRVLQKYNCAIAEVGDQDLWQSAQLGFAVVSNQRGFTQSMVQKILNFIDELAVAKLIDDEQDYIEYGEENMEGSSSGDYPHWEPEEPSPVHHERGSATGIDRSGLRDRESRSAALEADEVRKLRPPSPPEASSDYPWDPDPAT